MTILPENIQQYVEQHTTAEPALLQQLNRQTHQEVLMPQMLSGHEQGWFLKFISHMIKPKNILEIGAFTGYSAICLAEGLLPDGKLHSIEINPELARFHGHYFEKAGLSDRIVMHYGDATVIIPQLSEQFDVVFIDADKNNYSHYFDLVIDKVKPGGFILVDNVLWKGKVSADEKDKKTAIIDAFNKKANSDNRVENMIVPIRDGIMLMRRL